LPLLIDATTPGKEILHPVAVTIFGGIISATLLDAFVTPILFLRFGRKPLERLRSLSFGAEGGGHAAGAPVQAF
jgi:Cu/Ag efflux pump CusA